MAKRLLTARRLFWILIVTVLLVPIVLLVSIVVGAIVTGFLVLGVVGIAVVLLQDVADWLDSRRRGGSISTPIRTPKGKRGVCKVCGLPSELCICHEIEMEKELVRDEAPDAEGVGVDELAKRLKKKQTRLK